MMISKNERAIQTCMSKDDLLKTLLWVTTKQTEVGWKGVATMCDGGTINLHSMEKFPQRGDANGLFVDPDELYRWTKSREKELRRKLNYFGHSHGMRHINPSSIDLQEWADVVVDNSLYVFQIWNTKAEVNTIIYKDKKCINQFVCNAEEFING